jgi:hypothetical protein
MIKVRIFFIGFLILFIFLNHPTPVKAQEEPGKLYPVLHNYSRNLYAEYSKIPEERKRTLEEIANYLYGALTIDKTASIIFIGTNNSTRSIMAQVWAEAAAYYYKISNCQIYSGGTTTTGITQPAILSLEKAGFIAYKVTDGPNPRYEIKYTYNLKPIMVYSRKYNDRNYNLFYYGAVLVCPNADLNLPYERGMNFRTSLYYYDPSAYQGTREEMEMYDLRCREIAREMFYLFYCVKNKRR